MSIKPWKDLDVISCDEMAQERKHQIIKRLLQYYKRKPRLEFTDITDVVTYRYLTTPRIFENNKRYKPIRSTTFQLDKLCPALFQGKNLETYKTIRSFMRKGICFENLILNLRLAILILKVFANNNIPFYFPNGTNVTKNNMNHVLIPNFDKYLPLIVNGNICELSKYDDSLFMIVNCLGDSSRGVRKYDFGYLFDFYPDEYNTFITNLSQMKPWFEEQLDFFIKYIDAKTITFIPELFGKLSSDLFKVRHVLIFNNSIVLRTQYGATPDLLHHACQELGFDIKTVYTLHVPELTIEAYE